MTDLREAAGIEGLIVLGVIYFILNILQKVGKKAAGSQPEAPPRDPSGGVSATQQEALSLESILKEIEKVKAQHRPDERRSLPPAQAPRPLPKPKAQKPQGRSAPAAARKRDVPQRGSVQQSDRGPLGRHSRTGLTGAEEVEVRTTWEDQGSLEVEESIEVLDDTRLRPPRVEYDADEGAEEVVRRRIVAAESRNRALNAADHEAFDQRRMKGEVKAAAQVARFPMQRLRDAFIWREVLGPPKALEEFQ